MKFNINDYVKVRLTPLGIKIIQEERARVNQKIMDLGGNPLSNEVPKIDEYGYTKFQAWELMQIFGSYVGMARDLPFETEIIIGE